VERRVRRGEEVHRASGETAGLPIGQRGLALLACISDPPDWKRAEERIGEVVNELRTRDQRPELAVTHFRYAEIPHKKGDLERAMEQLAEAARLFRDMKMTWWTKQVEALRGRTSGASRSAGSRPTWTGRRRWPDPEQLHSYSKYRQCSAGTTRCQGGHNQTTSPLRRQRRSAWAGC
jgi:hypothetical protein